MRHRVIAYFLFSKWRPSARFNFQFSYFRNFCEKKNQICAYFYVVLQNLVTIGLSASEFLRIFIFRLDALALSVIATATWLAGWLGGWVGGCLSQPVLYQND